MDISPKILREVEFREKFRGYHPEDVDMFLERVAAGIEALQVQLRQATERAAHAEQLASAAGTTISPSMIAELALTRKASFAIFLNLFVQSLPRRVKTLTSSFAMWSWTR